jgi:site-specific recombinase XerD
MSGPEVAEFLSNLTVQGNVSASTQNQAFSALLSLYAKVLEQSLTDLGPVERARRPKKVPVVVNAVARFT